MFNRIQHARRGAVALLTAAAICFAPASAVAQAKGKDKEKEEEVKGYTLPYFFTLIGGLAIVVPVCMACKRKWDFARDDEDEE